MPSCHIGIECLGEPAGVEVAEKLDKELGVLCQLDSKRFIGCLPTTLSAETLQYVGSRDFFVSPKCDGIRGMLYVRLDSATGQQEVWLVRCFLTAAFNTPYLQFDRLRRFFPVPDLAFVTGHGGHAFVGGSIIDGEVVVKSISDCSVPTVTFIAFDCLAFDRKNCVRKPFHFRLKSLSRLISFRQEKKRQGSLRSVDFRIEIKDYKLAHQVESIFKDQESLGGYPCDGLIFTCDQAAYRPGRCQTVLKWKAPGETSADFRLTHDFKHNSLKGELSEQRSQFCLLTWLGGEEYAYYADLQVQEDEKQSLETAVSDMRDVIVEARFDQADQVWRFVRLRTDKPRPNHLEVVQTIMQNMSEPISLSMLLEASVTWKRAWHSRRTSGFPDPFIFNGRL